MEAHQEEWKEMGQYATTQPSPEPRDLFVLHFFERPNPNEAPRNDRLLGADQIRRSLHYRQHVPPVTAVPREGQAKQQA